MKKSIFFVCYLLITLFSFSQVSSKEYNDLIRKSRSLYLAKDYRNAAIAVSTAVRMEGDSIPFNDRDRAAYTWSLAGNADSAFYYLNSIAEMGGLTFEDYRGVVDDGDFSSLNNDPRWKMSVDKMFNKAKSTFHSSIKKADSKTAITENYKAGFAWLSRKEYDSAFNHLNASVDSKEFSFEDAFIIITDDDFIALAKGEKGKELENKIFFKLYKKYIPASAFSSTGTTPKRILIDGGHYNLHEISWTYATLAGTFRQCGFEVFGTKGKFEEISLTNTDMLIISNPYPDREDSLIQRARRAKEEIRWSEAFTQSAYTESEVSVIEKWIRDGGSLLLILDHAPYGKTGGLLTAALGIENRNVGTYDPLSRDPTVDTNAAKTILFTRSKGLIGKHPIVNGVDSVTTYTGESLIGPPGSEVLLYLPSTATDLDWLRETKQFRYRSAAGRSQAVAFDYGKGRVVMLGEAAITRPNSLSQTNRGNWKFVLNILRWLAREKME